MLPASDPVLGAAGRELVHTRRIHCQAWRRGDGLWEIEATVEDLKAEAVPFRSRPAVGPGEHMHHMRLTFLIDGEHRIRDVHAETLQAPWPVCPEVGAAYRRLIGLCIGAGFRKRVFEQVGGEQGCNHITDLITQVGNTYMQAAWPERVARQNAIDPDPRRWPDRGTLGFVGGCHAWRRGGETLRREYPELAEE